MWYLSDEQPEYVLSNMEAQNHGERTKFFFKELFKSLWFFVLIFLGFNIYIYYPTFNVR